MNRLKELRKLNGLTQREVAQAIGVSPQSYGYYENWINKPDPDTLIKLADFFGCTVDYLIGREDEFGNVTILPAFPSGLDGAEEELIKNFRKLDYYQQKAISIQTKALAEDNAKK